MNGIQNAIECKHGWATPLRIFEVEALELFAIGGTATFETIDVARLKSVWHP